MLRRAHEALLDIVADVLEYFGFGDKADAAIDFATLGEFGYERPAPVSAIFDLGSSAKPFDWSAEPDRFPASPRMMIVAGETGTFGGRGREVECDAA